MVVNAYHGIEDFNIEVSPYYQSNSRNSYSRHFYFDCKIEDDYVEISDRRYGDFLYDNCFVVISKLEEALIHIEGKLEFSKMDRKGNSILEMISEPITEIPIMPSNLIELLPEVLSAYAQRLGWSLNDKYGESSHIYTANDLPEIIIPKHQEITDYESVVTQLIKVFADVSKKKVSAIYKELIMFESDEIELHKELQNGWA